MLDFTTTANAKTTYDVSLAKVHAKLDISTKKRAAKTLGVSQIALILAACGSDDASDTTGASTTLLSLTQSGDNYSASSVTGFSLQEQTAANFDVADSATNAYAIQLDATGTGTLHFDFADASDEVVLQAGSKVVGFTTLKVTDGSIDATNADLSSITRVEVASGIKITLAQIKTIPTIVSNSEAAKVEIEVASEAEATELVELMTAGTVSVFGASNPIDLVAAPSAPATLTVEVLATKETETTATVKAVAEAPIVVVEEVTPEVPVTPVTPVAPVVVPEVAVELPDPFTVSPDASGGNYTIGTKNGTVTLAKSSGLYTLTPATGFVVGVTETDVTSFVLTNITLDTTTAVITGETVTGTGTVSITDDADADTNLTTIATTGINFGTDNTIAIASAKTLTLDADQAATATSGITGAGNVSVEDDAATANSSMLITATGTVTVDAGTGDDTIDLGAAENVTTDDTIDGGGGTDELQITADDGTTGAVLDDLVDIDTITVEAGSTATNNAKVTLTFTSADTTAMTITAAALTSADADFTLVATDAEADGAYTVVGGAGDDNMSTDAGDDNITGGTGTDIINSGAGNDTVTGNAGVKTINVGAGNDTVVLNAVAGTSSDSSTVVGGANADTGQHTITGLTFGSGTDKITVTASNINSFVHATDTDMGLGTGTDTLGTAASFTTKTGLIEFDLASGSNDANFKDVGDLVITLDAAVSEANFEAHLAYVLTSDTDGSTLTGGGLADTLTGGAGADTITGGAGVDAINGMAGADVIVIGTSHDGTAESYTGGDDTDTLQVDAAANFSNDTLATIEVLDLHEDGTTVAITMTEAQVDMFTTIKAAASAIGSGDKITLSDAMDADMLDGTTIGASTDADEVIIVLADVASNALTLVDATMAQASDKLFIDGSNLTGTNALTFNGAAEDDAVVMTITGGAAADTITGGDGADIITGGGGADIINGDAGNDVIHFGAADTGIGTIGDSAKSMLVANLDIITAAAGDVLNLSVLLETEGDYDNLDEHSAATSIDTTLTTDEVGQYVGTYDSATGKFLSTSTAASSSASTTDVDALLFAAANANSSDTTATDFFVVVGVSAQADSAIADGVITLA